MKAIIILGLVYFGRDERRAEIGLRTVHGLEGGGGFLNRSHITSRNLANQFKQKSFETDSETRLCFQGIGHLYQPFAQRFYTKMYYERAKKHLIVVVGGELLGILEMVLERQKIASNVNKIRVQYVIRKQFTFAVTNVLSFFLFFPYLSLSSYPDEREIKWKKQSKKHSSG